MLDYQPDFTSIGFEQFPDSRTGCNAVRSLEVDEFDDNNRRIFRSDLGRIIEWNGVARLIGEGKRADKKGKQYA
jgi:hypothetical protein